MIADPREAKWMVATENMSGAWSVVFFETAREAQDYYDHFLGGWRGSLWKAKIAQRNVDHEANSVYDAAAYRKALTFGGSAPPTRGDTP